MGSASGPVFPYTPVSDNVCPSGKWKDAVRHLPSTAMIVGVGASLAARLCAQRITTAPLRLAVEDVSIVILCSLSSSPASRFSCRVQLGVGFAVSLAAVLKGDASVRIRACVPDMVICLASSVSTKPFFAQRECRTFSAAMDNIPAAVTAALVFSMGSPGQVEHPSASGIWYAVRIRMHMRGCAADQVIIPLMIWRLALIP
jgi:hypothetical protein